MGERRYRQKPVPKWVFGCSLVVVGLLAIVVLLLAFGVLPADSVDGWRLPLIAVLLVASGLAALASNEIIPWEERKSLATWMQPKALGALTIMLIGTFGILADVFSLLGPSAATEEQQTELQETLERSSSNANEKLSEINNRVQDLGTGAASDDGEANDDPRTQIVKLTGEWSVEGFVEAIYQRQADVVDMYLKSGMSAAALHENASAILYGFQGDMNNDPVALLKTFRANGYNLDEELTDGRILDSISDSLPMRFDTELTPENYTGGYQDGVFAGPLLFWIVSRASYLGVTDQDQEVISYLISQGADCSVTLSFLDFNSDILSGTTPFEELYPTIEKCER